MECTPLWSEISQLRDWLLLSKCLIYWMWQLFPSYVHKGCLCMLWEKKFVHCNWASCRFVKISIRSSGIKAFMRFPLVLSHFTWWCSHTAVLVPPQHCQQTAGSCTAAFSISLSCFFFDVVFFPLHFDDSGTIWVVNFSGISWMNAVCFIYMKIFSLGLTSGLNFTGINQWD